MWSKYPHVEVAAPITAFRILGSEIQKDEPHIDVIVLGFFIFFFYVLTLRLGSAIVLMFFFQLKKKNKNPKGRLREPKKTQTEQSRRGAPGLGAQKRKE